MQHKASTATFGEFSYGAIFGVKNKTILSIEKDVYIAALTFVRSIGMAGHIMDILWRDYGCIFLAILLYIFLILNIYRSLKLQK